MESDEQIFVPSNYYPINRDECDFSFNSAPIKVLREHDYISVHGTKKRNCFERLLENKS